MARGERNPNTRLTEADIRMIRYLWNDGQGLLQREIAKRYGVTASSIGHIICGRRWGHVVD